MKKNTLSKLAVMGILSGSLVSSADAAQIANSNGQQGAVTQLAAGCGKGHCGGATPSNDQKAATYTADRDRNTCGAAHRPSNGQNSNTADRDRNSCGAAHRPSSEQRSSYTADRDAIYDSLAEASKDDAKNGNKSKKLSESDLKAQLNEKGKALYDSLDSEGKALALKLANGECKGKNDCKGLSSCKSDKNDCAGLNSCKGQGIGKFADKNLAVKVASKRMAEKRTMMNGAKQ